MAKPTTYPQMITGTHFTVYINVNTFDFNFLIIFHLIVYRTIYSYESGGTRGFSDVIWSVESHKKHSHVTFSYHSHENEQGTN